MQASVYIATSLDGFIARENGELDWLPGIDTGPDGEDYDYKDFIDTVDVLVMGLCTTSTWPWEVRGHDHFSCFA